MNIIMHSDRLCLKTLNYKDTSLLIDFYTRNKAFFSPWVPTYVDHFFDYGYQEKCLVSEEKVTRDGRMLKLFVFHKEDTDFKKIIGTVAFTNVVRGPLQSCFLGYNIDEEENGKGYASEAIAIACQYVFSKMKLHRIEANIIPRNAPSIRIVEKLNFEREGLSKRYLKINGIWEDHIRYSLLNDSVE